MLYIIIIINTLPSYLAAEPLLIYHKVNRALSGWTKPLYVGPCIHEASSPGPRRYLAGLTAGYMIQP